MGKQRGASDIERIIEAIQNKGEISYELRSKLNTLLGFSEVLEGEGYSSLTREQQDAIERIHKGSRAIAETLSETLNLTRIGTTLAREIALSEERVKQNQIMIKAIWAALALTIGWSVASHQFAVTAASEAAKSTLTIVEFKIDSLEEDVDKHLSSRNHSRASSN